MSVSRVACHVVANLLKAAPSRISNADFLVTIVRITNSLK